MRFIGYLIRGVKIIWTLLLNGVLSLPLEHERYAAFAWIKIASPFYWFGYRNRTKAQRAHHALLSLGPVFIKLGQFLSTRRDLFPEDVVLELAKLQEEVPPFAADIAKQIVRDAYNQDLEETFLEFASEPIAAASVAQVHGAILKDGTDVVVKIIRPGIEQIIRRDLWLMHLLSATIQTIWKDSKRLQLNELVNEFSRIILDELDMLREAANATLMRRHFDGSDLLYVPEVYWPYCRNNIMVMERISGVPVDDIETLKAKGVNLQKLSNMGVEIFFRQVFYYRFFHADMHPGNIWVIVDDPENPIFTGVDYGIVGTFSQQDVRNMAEQVWALVNRDYLSIAHFLIDDGWVRRADVRIDDLENSLRSILDSIFDQPLKEISLGLLLFRLFATAERFDIHLQPRYMLFGKTLLHIEGLGRRLDPELDLWGVGRPLIEDWIKRELGPKALLKKVSQHVPKYAQRLPDIPLQLHELLRKANTEGLPIKLSASQMKQLEGELVKSTRKKNYAILGGSMLMFSGMIWIAAAGTANASFSQMLVYMSAVTTVLSLVFLILALKIPHHS